MKRLALGVTIHTGHAACVLAGGGLREPAIEARHEIELLQDPQRFVFHRAAGLPAAEAARSVAAARATALAHARDALERVLSPHGRAVVGCAIVAHDGDVLPLADVLAAHPRIHSAEGHFYRDVLREAAEARGLATRIVPPRSLQLDQPLLGGDFGRPWARDQKLAALAAWSLLDGL